jgi:Fe2+ transport system protein FeoA
MPPSVHHLSELEIADVADIEHVGGERSFRRRLMELGLVPGTRVELKAIAPLGDPLELLVRGASLSIRRADAALVRVTRATPVGAKAAEPAQHGALEATPVRGAP